MKTQTLDELKQENKSLGKQIRALIQRRDTLQGLSNSTAMLGDHNEALDREIGSLDNRIKRKQVFHANNTQQVEA